MEVDASYIALLDELDAHVTSHSRRTLLEHLQGTHDLLVEWGNEPDVCVAGLFHSVYGTYAFDKRSADMSMRDEIRDVIGAQAERLVYLFCVTDRRCFYEHLGEARFSLRDIVHDRDLDLDRNTRAALIEIEVANILDQIPHRSQKKARRAAEWYGDVFTRSGGTISAAAGKAAAACFSKINAPAVEA
ncbi:MAG: hypothetical protein BMS9Abin01_1829 [Gammaproteobacteria bacterium]|nr:MAG: hypothetical protein BMS9Abin01_1829 [Gammaproteobacteria bacterium]